MVPPPRGSSVKFWEMPRCSWGRQERRIGRLHPAIPTQSDFQPRAILAQLKSPYVGTQTSEDPSPPENLPKAERHLSPALLGTQTAQDLSNLEHKLPICPDKRPP